MLQAFQRVLVLAPHTDDGEFGCGATIARLVQAGADVHYLAFSDCVDSLAPGLPPDTLVREVREATARLGIPPANVKVYSFPVRHFTRDRQDILELLVQVRQQLDPDLVLQPSLNDLHQDHQTIAREGLRAFKQTTIIAYEIPWNNLEFSNSFFVSVTEEHLQRKLDALAAYASQKDRYYANEETVRAQARLRGVQVGVRYAEMFEVVRAIAR